MSETLRKIVHVDMDAFYASVEQRDDPALVGKPVVVAKRGLRSVVTAASYEARVFGVRSAMPAVRAERLCPQAIFVDPHFDRYKAVSRQIRAIFLRHTDLVEPLSLDEAYLDVTITHTHMPSATEAARVIRAEIKTATGLTASAGIAPNKFLAKIASDWRKPDGQFVITPKRVEAFLLPLPIGKVPGVGPKMKQKLAALDVHTVGDLRAFEREDLVQRYGRWGRRLYELARGIDDRPVQPKRDAAQVSSEDTLREDLRLVDLTPHIERLAEKTWANHERKQPRVARTVVLKLKTTDFRILTRSFTPPSRPTSAAEVAQIACALRDRVDDADHTRYRLVGVGLSGFVDGREEAVQPSLI
ncbi:DNA polymerase IV [Endozoicomonas sp. G2_2]|uniref:DNA polymerase IV n=1 Tax=Endozoicomonas sp. G2_2 TaxID=2821092 RepID=UPI001ADA6EB6|nr:DNA polymerase IV [Endozoicomonas sp. G2_2]MBO9470794.1 DNA polymerase IV [Endozoicomonas sp. G2_2]